MKVLYSQFYSIWIVILVLLPSFQSIQAQINKRILMEWKLAPDEYLCYQINRKKDVDERALQDLASTIYHTLRQQKNNLELKDTLTEAAYLKQSIAMANNEYVKETNLAILRNKNNELQFFFIKISEFTDENEEFTKSIDIICNGILSNKGGIIAAALPPQNEMEVAQIFELPKESVSVGDNWSIRQHLFGNGNVLTTKIELKNSVSLLNINFDSLEPLAHISYDITYHFEGKQYNNLILNYPCSILTQYTAEGEFNFKKGRWKSYSGYSKNNIVWDGNQFQKEEKITINEVPLPEDILRFLETI